jgi:hypothetical protein
MKKVIIVVKCGKKKKRIPHYVLFLFPNSKKGGTQIMETLKVGETRSFTLSVLDVKGRPAPIDGTPIYENSNPGVVDLFVAEGGLSGTVTHLDGGDARITATIDADLGEGVRNIVAIADIHCLPLEAQTVAFNFAPATP